MGFELIPSDGNFLIKSMTRHVDEEWVIHVRGRINPTASSVIITENLDIAQRQSTAQSIISGSNIYATARDIGIIYGSSFQWINKAWICGNRALAHIGPYTDLGLRTTIHRLYPGILDSCFQILFGILAVEGNSNNAAYLPVRLGRLQLIGLLPEEFYVTAELMHLGKHSVRANFAIVDRAGVAIALISDCSFKKSLLVNAGASQSGYVCHSYLLSQFTMPTACDQSIFQLIRQQGAANIAHMHQVVLRHFESVMPLIDLMIGRFIYTASMRLLKNNNIFSLESLLDAGVVMRYVPYLKWGLNLLVEDGLLCRSTGNQYCIVQHNEILDPHVLWTVLINNYPEYLAELVAIGRIGLHLPAILCGQEEETDLYNDLYPDITSKLVMNNLIAATLTSIVRQIPATRRIRILDIGMRGGSVTNQLLQILPADRADYLFVDIIADKSHSLDNYQGQFFDLIIVRDYLHMLASQKLQAYVKQLHRCLHSSGILCITERRSDRVDEFIFGLDPDWWNNSTDEQLISKLRPAVYWRQHLTTAGFAVEEPLFESAHGATEGAFLLIAHTTTNNNLQISSVHSSNPKSTLFLSSTRAIDLPGMVNPLTVDLAAILQSFISEHSKSTIVWVVDPSINLEQISDGCSAIVDFIKILRDCNCANYPRVVFVTNNAMPPCIPMIAAHVKHPIHAVIWGLVRVLSNEQAEFDCKLIDLHGTISHKMIKNLLHELSINDHENEVLLTEDSRYGMRIERKTSLTLHATDAPFYEYYLDFERAGSLNNLQWFKKNSQTLDHDEVAVRPHASGLNFRDIMYSMGLIPDEAVDSGFFGASLGMEFAGEIIAIGSQVANFKIGDRVMGFAPASFSSIAITRAHALTLLPLNWDYNVAATVPIAFFTAYYALQHLGQIQAGERILIHGAAGGVGIAAIQIAKHFNAKIYATAGSAAKRDFLKLLGVEYIYDSRTLLFADEILLNTSGSGVDLVLNCLAGDAITANLAVLQPFGRFLELGKRDFFANSKIGLRPFKNNISYFGIDADQLLIRKPDLCVRLFKEIMGLFQRNILNPLPYRSFSAQHVQDAFKYMQQSRHIGKIIINLAARPQSNFAPVSIAKKLTFSDQGAYLITGGLSGFGLCTALWLAEKGARYLVLVGRRGAHSEEARNALDILHHQGVNVLVQELDISDAILVTAMIAHINTNFAPLKGLIHAAVVYDDAIFHNLNQPKLENVIKPKAQGAWNLHCSTVDCQLDFFVAYSSVTTLFGNPGQANYVAANLYLENLIAYRRSRGLPGIAVAWGPLEDVGYLARNVKLKQVLTGITGTKTLVSNQALRVLEQLMLADIHGFVVANLNLNKLQLNLPVIAKAKFCNLLKDVKQLEQLISTDAGDFLSWLQGCTADESRAMISNILIIEIAKILRLPSDKIDPQASLFNIGMDSLVAVELMYIIEQRFALKISMLALTQSLSVHAIAERILKQIKGAQPETELTSMVATTVHDASLHGEIISAELAKELVHDYQG